MYGMEIIDCRWILFVKNQSFENLEFLVGVEKPGVVSLVLIQCIYSYIKHRKNMGMAEFYSYSSLRA